jgi:hypothetical protein
VSATEDFVVLALRVLSGKLRERLNAEHDRPETSKTSKEVADTSGSAHTDSKSGEAS